MQKQLDNALLKRIADNIRVLSAAMPEQAKSGHPGGAMGGADFMALLYTEFLNFDPSDMAWPHRDRFFQDAGHLSAMMYGTLSLFGKYSMEELSQFRQWGSPTPGHPERDVPRGLENTSGPLGQGHVMGAGAAIAERVLSNRFGNWLDHKTVCYITDGGVQEEASQGVGRIVGHLGLSNFIMFYDSNDVQLSHMTKDAMSEDTAKKYEAWGWAVETVSGHDYDALRAALKRAWARTDRPTFILGKTVTCELAGIAPRETMNPNFFLSDDDNIILNGLIDWIEYIPETDSLHIIDFKTGKHEENEKSLQLPIYLLLCNALQKRAVTKASYWYLESDKLVEKELPDADTAFRDVLEVAVRVKEARVKNEFVCPKGEEGCNQCRPYEQILAKSPAVEFVGTGLFKQDMYIVTT